MKADISVSLVSALIGEQFALWSEFELTPVISSGTDNKIFRLGQNMCVRMPASPENVASLMKENTWLPSMAPLPLQIPTPIAIGQPGCGYPDKWCIFDWITGENPKEDALCNSLDSALAIAEFISALQLVDTSSAPVSGSHNNYRGVPLQDRDRLTREAISRIGSVIDPVQLLKIWERALETHVLEGAPVWLHGDIHSGNLLMRNDKLCAVIDFGLSGVGDPACDLMIGWTEFDDTARQTFRNAMGIDAAAWARGMGWALSWAVIALAYYIDSNPFLASKSRKTIERVLASEE